MQFDSSFSINTVILITSDKSIDKGQTRRIHDDLSVLSKVEKFNYWHQDIKCKDDLLAYLHAIDNVINDDGMKPVLHFHMHGCKDQGLEIGDTGEFVSWDELTPLLRKINISLKNNLCVISTACYGFYFIQSIEITEATPYFCLIAAQEKIKFGYIDDNTSKFYQAIFKQRSIDEAYEHVSNMFEYYHCEKMLITTLGKYILKYCKGRTKDDRKENLITRAIEGGIEPTNENLKNLRNIIKDQIKPKQELLNKYIQIFLIGKPIKVTMDDILSLVESSYI